jgi:hypothetical protein
LNDLWWDSFHNEQRRQGMPQIVQTNLGQAEPLTQPSEVPLQDVIAAQWAVDFRGKYEVLHFLTKWS